MENAKKSARNRRSFHDFPGLDGFQPLCSPVLRLSTTWRAHIVTALDRSWQPIASCSGSHSHLFFPPNVTERKEERERREIRAKSVCKICPVGGECLDYAMTIGDPHGIWGGLTERERRQQKARFSA
jgi:WhiB family redox-sensing transcriptional regulator